MNPEKELRKENNRIDKQLTKENNRLLTDMIVYLHSGDLCEYDIEIIRKELLGMALEAQARDDDFKNVIGDNYKEFCNELMESGRQKTKYEKGLEWSYVLIFGIGALSIFEYISNVIMAGAKTGFNSFSLKFPISWGFAISTICCVIVAFIIYNFVSKNSFELNSKKYKIIFGCLVGFLFAAILLVRILMGNTILCTVNAIYMALLIVVLFIIVKILDTKHANYLAQTHK